MACRGADTLFGGDGADRLAGGQGSDFLSGDAGADELAGDAGNDTLDGGAGNDFVSGAAGSDIFIEQDGSGDDTYAGGADSDLLDFTAASGDVAVDLVAGTAVGTGTGNDTLSGIENIRGGAGDDTIVGDDGANSLSGGGDDTLSGELGDDVFDASDDTGDDTYIGGEGFDTADYFDATAVINADLATGTVTVTGLGSDLLSEIERLVGGAAGDILTGSAEADTLDGGLGGDVLDGAAGNDVLLGNDGDDTLKGSAGEDVLVGGDGFDTLDYSAQTQSVTLAVTSGDAIGASIGTDIFGEIERFLGGSAADLIVGSEDADTIEAGAGGDTVLGGAGRDTILGGDGDDELAGNGEDDVLDGGSGEDLLFGGNGVDTLLGGEGDDNLIGDDGDDTLDGGAGFDLHFGGASNDYFIGAEDGSGDEFFGGDDPDDAESTALGTLSGSDTVDYAAVTTSITVNLAGRFALGDGIGADTLSGGGGADRFLASRDEGDDTIDGGSGLDMLDYSGVAGNVTIDAVAGTAIHAGLGADEIANLEHFIGGDDDDSIFGGAASETLQGGAGSDLLSGGGSADTIFGGTGDDTLIGGAGDDSLIGGEGIDAVDYSGETRDLSVDLVLGTASLLEIDDGTVTVTETDTLSGIEHAITGAGNDSLTGSGAGEVFDSGGGIDTVLAGDGNDRVIVAADTDADSYDGGSGTDLLDFTPLATDLVADLTTQSATFTVGTVQSADVFTGFEGIVGGAGNDTIGGTADDDRLFGGDGNDTLSGIGGTDRIEGGDGDDLIIAGGGVGEDEFDGGAGFDVLDLSDVALSLILNLADGTASSAAGGEQVTRRVVNIERIVAGGGDDTIFGSDSADDIDGGAGSGSVFAFGGEDCIVFDAADAVIDGGDGVDTLAVADAGLTLDTALLTNIRRIEAIDLSGTGSNTVTATADLILDKSDTKTVTVVGDGDDLVQAVGDWTVAGTSNVLAAANTAELHVGVDSLINTGAIGFADGASLSVGTLGNQAELLFDGVSATIGGRLNNETTGVLTIDSSSASVSLAVAGGLSNLSQVTLAGGAGSLDIQSGIFSNASSVDIVSGNQTVDGSFDNAAGGSIFVAAPATLQFGVAGGAASTLTNSGTIEIEGAMRLVDASLQHNGGLILGLGATLDIGDGALAEFQTDFTLLSGRTIQIGDGNSGSIAGTATATNQGEIVLDGGAIDGTLVNQGALRSDDAFYRVDGDLTLESGSIDMGGSKTLTGEGTVINRNDFTLEDDTIAVDFVHAAGTLQLASQLDITGSLTLEGDAVVNTEAGVVIAGSGALDNSGTITVSGATLNSDSVVNQALMSFEGAAATVASDAVTNTVDGTMLFLTDVLFDLDADQSLGPDVDQTLANFGTLDIDDGTVTVRDDVLAHHGVIDVAGSAALAFDGGTLSMQAGGALSGSGVVSFSSALDIASGVTFTNASNGPALTFENGDLVGAGSFVNEALLSMGGGTIGVANFTNAADGVLQAENGSIAFSGGTFTSLADATLSVLSDTADALIALPSGFSNAGVISFAGSAAAIGTLGLGGNTIDNLAGAEIAVANGIHQIDGGVDNKSDALVSVAAGTLETTQLSLLNGLTNLGTIALNATDGGGSGVLDLTQGTVTTLINDSGGIVRFGGAGALDTLTVVGNIDNQGVISAESDAFSQIGGAGAAISNSGTVSVASGSTLTVGDATGPNGSFDNTGTVRLDGDLVLRNTVFEQGAAGALEFLNGTFVVSDGGRFDAASGAVLGTSSVFDLATGGVIASDSPGDTLTNQGIINFNGGTLTADTVNDGTLTTSVERYDLTGALSNGASGTLDLDGAIALGGGGSYAFEGTVDLSSDTVEASTTVSVSNAATLTGATVAGTLVALDGFAPVLAGTLSGSGVFDHQAADSTPTAAIDVATVMNSGGLALAGGALTGTLVENTGAIDVTGAASFAMDTLTNQGNISVGTIGVLQQGAGGTLSNEGVFAVAAGGLAEIGTITGDVAAFDNSGSVTVGGNLLLRNTVFTQQADSDFDVSGTVALAEDSTLDLGADVTLGTGGTLLLGDGAGADERVTGAGDFVNQGTVDFNGAVLSVDMVNSGSLIATGGRYDIAGTLSFQGNGSIDLSNAEILAGGGVYAFTPGASFSSGVDLTGNTILDAATTVTIANGLDVTIADTVIDGLLEISGGATPTFGGTLLSGDGTLDFAASGSIGDILVDVATLVNSGSLELSGGTLANVAAINTGVIDILASSVFDVFDPLGVGTIANSGTVSIQDGFELSFGDGTDDGLFANTGVIDTAGSGTLTVAGGTLDLSGGTINGTGLLDNRGDAIVSVAQDFGGAFANSGRFTIDGVAFAANAVTLSAGGTLTLDGTEGDASLAGGTELVNSGLLEVAGGSGSLGGATVSNASGATISVESGAELQQDSGATLSNSGAMAVAGTVALEGGVAVNVGTLSLDGGTLTGTGSLTNDGLLSLADGAFSALDILNEGTISTTSDLIEMSGTVTTQGSGTFLLNEAVTLGSDGVYIFANAVDLTGDTVGAQATASVAGSTTLTNAAVEGVLVAAGGAALQFGGTLSGGGTLQHDTASSTLTAATVDVATFTNSGALSLGSGGVLSSSSITNTGLLENGGTIDLSSDGSMLLSGGTLGLNAGAIVSAEPGSAAITLDGGTIALGDSFTLDADLTLAAIGTQTNSIALDTLTFASDGIVSVAADAVLSVTAATGGAFVDSGTLEIGDGGTVSLTDVTLEKAAGTFELGGDFGTATVGGDLSLGFANVLQVGIGETGTVTESDLLSVTGDAALGGTLSIGDVGGFTLSAGDSFEVLSSTGTLSQSFDFVSGLDFSDSVILDLSQSTNGVTLTGVGVTTLGDDDEVTGDVLEGGAGVEVFVARDGDDRFESGGGSDLMHGGGGDDVFVAVDTGFGRFDGGTGEDTLLFEADTDQTFDLTALRGDQLSLIERIDIRGAADLTLALDVDTVLSATDSGNTLIIDGDDGDLLDAAGTWGDIGSTTIGSEGYTIFENDSTGAQILLNTDMGTVTV